jgi:chromosome segregation ATPase
VENEEFENADALNQRIESLSAQLNAAQQQQRLAEAAVVRLQSEQVALSTKLQRDLNDFNSELRKHQQHQQGQLGRYQDEQNHKISEQEDRLNAEVDRIQRSLSHTEKDIALVEDEQKSIDDGIYERTKETQEEKQVLITQKQEIQGKIDELMLQVRALQSELDTCEGSLRVVETKINVTRTSYEKPLRRIHEKRVRILAGSVASLPFLLDQS